MGSPRIVITNGWSDDNKGDAAIVHGLINLLREKNRGNNIYLLSTFSSSDPEFAASYRHTSGNGSGVEVLTSLLPSKVWGKGAIRKMRRIWFVWRGLWLLLAARLYRVENRGWFLDGLERRALGAVARADVVIAKGGHLYFSDASLRGLLSLFMNLHPLLLAQRFGRPCVVYAQSIGPVNGVLQRWLLRKALRKCDKIVAREQLTYDLVQDLLGSESAGRLTVGWDTAFAISPDPLPADVERMLPDKFIAVTVRQWHFPYESDPAAAKSAYARYLQSVSRLIEYCEAEEGLPAVLVPQVIGPTEMENDYQAWVGLKQYCTAQSVIELRADLTPGQLASVYQRAEALIGTRFHSVILAASVHTPSLAISYHGYKSIGIMRMLGLDDYVIDIGALQGDDLTSRMKRLLGNRAWYRKDLADKHTEILAGLRLDLESTLSDALPRSD